jgi:ABC-2 type transport system ATP-binding protein
MQQKVQFIAAVLHEPDLIILDEPFSGLDPVNMRLLRDLFLEQHQAGRTVIFSTHAMHQAEQLCDHIVMINKGVKVLDDTLEDIRSRHDPRTIAFEAADLSRADGVRSVPGVRALSQIGGHHEVSLEEGADPAQVMRGIVGVVPVTRIELRRPTLEDIFIDVVQRDVGEPLDEARLRAELRDGAAELSGVEA